MTTGGKLQGLALNRVSYATLVEAYAEAGQLSTAESWAAAASGPHVAPAGAPGDWLRTVLLKARVQVHPAPICPLLPVFRNCVPCGC